MKTFQYIKSIIIIKCITQFNNTCLSTLIKIVHPITTCDYLHNHNIANNIFDYLK